MRDWKAIAARVNAEGPIPVSEAAKLVKAEQSRRGYVSANTLIRWIVHGKRGVFLDGIQFGGETWYTSEAALLRFAAELSEKAARVAAPVASPSELKRRDDAAWDMMRAAGLNA